MAYNLQSLLHILNQILHPHHRQPWVVDPIMKPQMESLLGKARCLDELFENPSLMIGDRVQDLGARIMDAVHEAEDLIESHLVEQLASNQGKRFVFSPPDLQKVIGDFDVIEEEMTKLMDGTQIRDSSSSFSLSLTKASNPENIVEGLNEDLIQLKDRVIGHQSKLDIIPIVGMGGIGKTTLAQKLYDDPFVVSHFDKCAWTTISQDYDLREILLGLLRCLMGSIPNEMMRVENDKLALNIHKTLCDRRYLIVLDDMWSSEVWDGIRMCFPDDVKGSRVVVTTREVSVANYVGLKSLHHQMKFLNEVESWNLLRRKVFAKETCPPKLEVVGKKIAKDCAGLPLAIHVVGGLLAQLGKSEESWLHIAKDVNSAIASKDDQFSTILSLSYNHLPNHLRPCFLYMGAFPEDYMIRPSKLIRLWIAEGFVKPLSGENLEEAARLYLKELVDRNLLLAHRQEVKGIVKSYIMHDMLRDLCICKAYEEKFLYVWNPTIRDLHSQEMVCLRRHRVRILKHLDRVAKSADLRMVTRSIMLFVRENYKFEVYSRFANLIEVDLRFADFCEVRLLRVLNLCNKLWFDYPQKLEKLFNLKYLAFDLNMRRSVYTIPTLYNLQTLIVSQQARETFSCRKTREIFDMPRLRHVKFIGRNALLEHPHGDDVAILEDLQTLSTVVVDNDFSTVLRSFPNLRKLGIFGQESFTISSIVDMTHLSKLETLKCSSDGQIASSSFLSFLVFPPSLKKLTLRQCRVPLGYMETIGTLPNLEVLKLQESNFESSTWEPTEGEFHKLRFLLLQKLNLENWIADEAHYPRLECLIIRDCSQLEEIPCGIGGIPTLETIEVHGDISRSTLDSARIIQNEQLDWGNDLQVRIFTSSH